MSSRYMKWGPVALICLLASTGAHADVDCSGPAVVLGDKPSMDAYADYSDFLVAIMDYKARQRELKAQQESCPELFVKHIDPTTLDPTVTYGPETLDSAVKRTRRLEKLGYEERTPGDGRSTSRNFKLPTLGSSQMEGETIRTPLRTLVDEPVSEHDQQLILSLLGPLDRADGSSASVIQNRQLEDQLVQEAKNISLVVRANQPYDQATTYRDNQGGYITLYFNKSSLVKIDVLAQGCLSRCEK